MYRIKNSEEITLEGGEHSMCTMAFCVASELGRKALANPFPEGKP